METKLSKRTILVQRNTTQVRRPRLPANDNNKLNAMTWHQTSGNNSTPPRFSKNIQFTAIIRGRIVGRIVAQYSTRPPVEYLYFRGIWRILVESNRT